MRDWDEMVLALLARQGVTIGSDGKMVRIPTRGARGSPSATRAPSAARIATPTRRSATTTRSTTRTTSTVTSRSSG